ncbi:MAG: cytochrome C assembly protein [Dehalococcoidia bacterium]|nr:cytochrome C assembly protein [Dehalococcoidia bacterium]
MQLAKQVLLPITGVMMLLTLSMVFLWVPTDANLGVSQRIFYFHVPLAIMSLLPPFLVSLSSIGYLWRRNEGWDALSLSAVEVGVLFTTLTLATGSIWARPTWGVWWRWDPMLTTFFILWLMYLGYLLLRAYAPSPDQGARYSAVLGIVGSVNSVIVYMATVWWNTQHPEKVVGPAAEAGSLDARMGVALLVAFATFALLFAYVLLERLSLRRDEAQVEVLRAQLEEAR